METRRSNEKDTDSDIPELDENYRSISIWLDGYDDLFSDFDPRPYISRNISDDFLYELKKLSSERDMKISTLKFLLPEKMREAETEKLISKRLHSHFRLKLSHHERQLKKHHRIAFILLASGFALLFVAGYFSAHLSKNFFYRILFIVTEPSGWFFAWTGFERLLSEEKKNLPDLKFYRKIAKAKTTFASINEKAYDKHQQYA